MATDTRTTGGTFLKTRTLISKQRDCLDYRDELIHKIIKQKEQLNKVMIDSTDHEEWSMSDKLKLLTLKDRLRFLDRFDPD
jgi:hypothetical protein